MKIMWQMKQFLVILGAFVLQTSISLMAFMPGEPFHVYWERSYQLVYAGFDDYEAETDWQRLFFVGVTLVVTLVLLNLLIAIISDTYDHVLNTKESEDVLERLNLIREIQKYYKVAVEYIQKAVENSQSIPGYIHFCTNAKLEMAEEVQYWEGKVKYLENSIQSLRTELQEKSGQQNEQIRKILKQNTRLKQRFDNEFSPEEATKTHSKEKHGSTFVKEKVHRILDQNKEPRQRLASSLPLHLEPKQRLGRSLSLNQEPRYQSVNAEVVSLNEKIDQLIAAKDAQEQRMGELIAAKDKQDQRMDELMELIKAQ